MSNANSRADRVPLPTSTSVHLESVTKEFKGHEAVSGVTLSASAGEVLAIIGPSGAGKSTLLRCINFLEIPTSGRIVIGDQSYDVTLNGPPRGNELVNLRRRVGMVFQSFNLFPHMTMLRNVALPQERVLKRKRADAEERSRDLLELMGLGDKSDQYPNRCSGGQQQRAAIARALALDPEVMLFDEPTSALDPELGAEVLTAMKRLADEGRTMVMVTHELHFADDIADFVAVMVSGRVVESGPPHDVLHSPQNERVARFIRATER
ncbi:amino acid ABC transporter ATP-binding protein [Leekyejoonella antrihumi]|uniref:Amino acid ABC transporter ATP-binding protein n=1 Tax=Leekyejoonella antrihumi TaxID=1660198 RepID=A0A563DQ67_9MICO|nr:amino acid ABC transporter ATP-binding protein [Leekyejoonella antrihumi]